jgi:hypothetical protein
MYVGSKRPTDVESPRWTTVVHRVVVGATGATVLGVVAVVVVVVVVALVVVVDTAGVDAGAVDRLFAVAAVATVSAVTSRAVGAGVDPTSSPCASGSALHPTANVPTSVTTDASGATRRGRATSRV